MRVAIHAHHPPKYFSHITHNFIIMGKVMANFVGKCFLATDYTHLLCSLVIFVGGLWVPFILVAFHRPGFPFNISSVIYVAKFTLPIY